MHYSIINTPHPDILVNDIINAFYYSNMHAKKIKICLFKDKASIIFETKNIKIHAVFNSSLVKFLMHSTYTYFIFFVTPEGILDTIYFDNNIIPEDAYNENILLTINHSIENNLFDLTRGTIILKNNNTQKTIHIIKKILKDDIIINK